MKQEMLKELLYDLFYFEILRKVPEWGSFFEELRKVKQPITFRKNAWKLYLNFNVWKIFFANVNRDCSYPISPVLTYSPTYGSYNLMFEKYSMQMLTVTGPLMVHPISPILTNYFQHFARSASKKCFNAAFQFAIWSGIFPIGIFFNIAHKNSLKVLNLTI